MLRRWLILAAVSLMVVALPGYSQTPTSEQLEMLRSMSPEDREALLSQLGTTGQNGEETVRGRDPKTRDNGLDENGESRLTSELRAVDKSLKPDDTVLINIDLRKDIPPRVERTEDNERTFTVPGETAPPLEGEEKAHLESLVSNIRARNPYQLDSNGALQLPGFAPIVLTGLDEEQATQRLQAVGAFQKIAVSLVRLPIRKSGIAGLKPFGYDLFKNAPSTFAPVTDVPVPSEYIVGPGDQLNVQLFGSQNRNLKLVVGRDGRVSFPELGPINVSGRTFLQVAADLEARVARQMIGVRASVGMGDTRSIRVFIMGEAKRPGSYTISGLATITSALYATGGVTSIGSLRDIQLKRAGAVVRRMDLYDLLLRGDTSDDAKLLPGDVIFIPPISATVAVDGEVNRPAIYELKGETSVADIVALAGGLTNEADTGRVALVRINAKRERVVLNVPLDADGSREILVRGDSLRVLRLRPTLDEGVTIEGHVFRPGPVAWHDGLRLTDVIGSVEEIKPKGDLHYVLIRRERSPDRHIEMLSADLGAALGDPSSPENLKLMPRDRVYVFDMESTRREFLDPLIDEMRRQSRIDSPSEIVRVDGRVKARGDYPLEPGMRVSDLLRAGGGLSDAAYGSKAELTRYRLQGDMRQTQLIEIDMGAVLKGDISADLLLQPYDFLSVKEIPEWSEQEQVTLRGEVRFPGIYPIQRGETLRSVLVRAGGLTSLAFSDGAVFTRDELQKREQEQVDRLADRLQNDLVTAALQASATNQATSAQSMQAGQSLLSQLKKAKAVGRLVIDLDRVLAAQTGSANDIALRQGDQLVIPKQKQEVTVIGEVQTTTSHFYRDDLTRDDYIGLSGGTTRKADRGRIYIVRADGSVISSENAGWFRRSANVAMRPGDTIVVPLDTERMPALPLWQAVTSIVYNLAIAAAAINSF